MSIKKNLVFAILLIASVSANAQYAPSVLAGRTVRFGFKLDPVFASTLSPKENGVAKDGSGFGINYGLMADINFRDDARGAFATGIEVNHSNAKLKYTDASKGLHRTAAESAEQNYKIKLQHIQIPLSVKLRSNWSENNVRWWGQFGTYLGALIGSRSDFSASGATSISNENIMKQTNRVNMGLLLGAGAEYHISEKTDLVLGLGLENGFTDITNNRHWNDGKVALNRWALRIGMFF